MKNKTEQRIQKEPSMFCNSNRYGYKLSVNHPLINKIYNRYKKANNIPCCDPLSDNERLEFEAATINYLKKKGFIE